MRSRRALEDVVIGYAMIFTDNIDLTCACRSHQNQPQARTGELEHLQTTRGSAADNQDRARSHRAEAGAVSRREAAAAADPWATARVAGLKRRGSDNRWWCGGEAAAQRGRKGKAAADETFCYS